LDFLGFSLLDAHLEENEIEVANQQALTKSINGVGGAMNGDV